MIVFVLYYLCVQSLVFRRAQGEERDGKKRKERIERQELKECGGVTSAAATRWVETQDSVLAARRKSEDNELRRYNQAVAHVKSSQREVQKVNSNRLEREKSLVSGLTTRRLKVNNSSRVQVAPNTMAPPFAQRVTHYKQSLLQDLLVT